MLVLRGYITIAVIQLMLSRIYILASYLTLPLPDAQNNRSVRLVEKCFKNKVQTLCASTQILFVSCKQSMLSSDLHLEDSFE